MSALTTLILSRPNVVYLGDTDAANGTTTLTDLSGTQTAGVEVNSGVSRNGFGAADGPIGHSSCWESSASEVRGFQVAAAATAGLQLQVLTLLWFFKMTAANNGPIHLGRQNGISGSVGSSRKVVAVFGGGVTAPGRSNPSTITLNVWHCAALVYDGHEYQPYLDGAPEGAAGLVPGPFTSFANRIVFGGDTGQLGSGHRLALPTIVARRMHLGEIAAISRAGIGAPSADHQAVFDFPADDLDDVIAGSGIATTHCMGCGGRRRVAEGGYKSAAASPVHQGSLACVGAAGLHRADPSAPLTNTGTDRDIDNAHARLAMDVWLNYAARPSTDKPWGQAATGELVGSGVTTAIYGGFLTGAGILQRHYSGDPASSPLQSMKLTMAYLRSVQIPGGNQHAGYFSTDGTEAGSWGGNFIFSLAEMLPGIIAVWDILDADTRAVWLDTLRKAAAGVNAVERNFWVNGNYILFYWMTQRLMVELDPGGPWQANADFFLGYLFSPSGSSSYVGSGLTGVGTRKYVDGTPTNDPLISLATMRGLNPASDKIYATEGNSATATAAGSTFNTTYGFDPNYVGAQAGICLAVYLATGGPAGGDADAWQMAQLFANAIVARQNFSTGTVTINGFSVQAWYSENHGTRHNAVELGAGGFWHTMRRLGRTDFLTAQQLADRHAAMRADAVLNTTQQNVWYRTLGDYVHTLEASPYWPKRAAA